MQVEIKGRLLFDENGCFVQMQRFFSSLIGRFFTITIALFSTPYSMHQTSLRRQE
jgi:hypothetical protein